MGCCVLAFSPLSKEEIFPFIKITHNSRYSFKDTWFFIEFIRCLLEYEDKEQALQQAEQRCCLLYTSVHAFPHFAKSIDED